MPGRTCNHTFGTQSPDKVRSIAVGKIVEPHYDEGKHLYWKPLMVAGRTRAKRLGLKVSPYPKPNAARPSDETPPSVVSFVQPEGAAPTNQSE